MKTLYLTQSSNIIVDVDNNKVDRLKSSYQGIDRMYTVSEPMHVVYGEGEDYEEFDVKKGDIVITFYTNAFKHRAVVVKSKAWYDNIVQYEKKQQSAIKLDRCANCESIGTDKA